MGNLGEKTAIKRIKELSQDEIIIQTVVQGTKEKPWVKVVDDV